MENNRRLICFAFVALIFFSNSAFSEKIKSNTAPEEEKGKSIQSLVNAGLEGKTNPINLPNDKTSNPLEVSQVFFIQGGETSGKFNYNPTLNIELNPGQEYGWMVSLKSREKPVTWKETYKFKKPLGHIPEDRPGQMLVSVDGKTIIATGTSKTHANGLIFLLWGIAKDDNENSAEVDISLDGKHVATFNVTFSKPSGKKK